MTSRNKLLLAILILALAALSCQAVTQVFEQTAPTSVRVLLPTQDQDSTTPPTTVLTAEPTPTLFPLEQSEQLQIFQELWEIINEEYLYADFNGVDWDQVYDEYRGKIEAGLATPEFYLAMDEMIYALNDEHSIFLNPQQVAAEEAEYAGDNDYVGIGIWMQYVPEKQRAVILLTFPGGPAEEVGLKAHDSILAVDGVRLDDEDGAALDSLFGVEDTEVTIVVQSPGEPPREMTLHRGRITGSLPVPYDLFTTPDGKRIGYIVIPTFSDSGIGNKVGDALSALTLEADLDGIILDNRLNGGGYDDIMSSTLGYFTSGVVGHFINRYEEEALRVSRKNIGGSTELPLVVLVGPDTVSFGEIFSGILKDQGRATLIGETTDGNVEILWGYYFDDGSRAWIAHDTFKPVNNPDADWEHEGIVVDVEVPADWDEYTTETDPAIRAALEHFDRQ
ncbi:MAG: S41 family peptidase [Anaerolineales bacterium]|jgi:C-terminal peptidase prc